jgi:hypothetical protein
MATDFLSQFVGKPEVMLQPDETFLFAGDTTQN